MRLHFQKMAPRYRLTKPSYLETATNDMAKYVGCLFFSFSGLSVCLLCRTDSVFYSFSVSFLQWGGQISRPGLSRSNYHIRIVMFEFITFYLFSHHFSQLSCNVCTAKVIPLLYVRIEIIISCLTI